MNFGSMPNDGGNLLFNVQEYESLSDNTRKYCRKYMGSSEFINGIPRYCLWLYEVDPSDYSDNVEIEDLVDKVKKYRLGSKRKETIKLADVPELFGEIRYPSEYSGNDNSKYSIIVPRVSSENRVCVPMGMVDSSVIISDSAMAIYDAPIWLLGLLESRMHMTWLRAVGGKLETRYRYSAGLVYNTFPVPEISDRRISEIKKLTVDILDIRNEEGGTLAELYGTPLARNNPKPMNERLLKAHRELDQVVDRAYRQSGFKDDSERLSYLLKMYSNETKSKDEQD